MINVYGLTPVNSTAAAVTSQSGCSANDKLTTEQIRENLVAKAQGLQKQIVSSAKGSEEGARLRRLNLKVCNELANMKQKKKLCRGLQSFFMDVAKQDMPRLAYERMLNKAKAAMEASIVEAVE